MKKLIYTIFSMFMFMALFVCTAFAESQVVPHEGNILFPESTDYAVAVNGIKIPVRAERVDNYPWDVAMFSVEGECEVNITALKGIKKYKISPTARGVETNVQGNTISFKLGEPMYLLLEMQDSPALILLITPPEKEVPSKDDPNVIYFGPGVHETGVINMKSNQTVYIASGAVVHGRIQGVNVDNIKVLGRGVLEAEKYTTSPYPGVDNEENNKGVWKTNNRTKGLYFQGCTNGKIDGISVRNAHKWQALYLMCKNFEISNMNTMAMRVQNDGLDVDTVEDFYIHDNFIMSGDDGFGWHTVRAVETKELPTRNVRADNNTIYNSSEGGNGIRFGSSMETELWENITITNTYILNSSCNAVMLDIQDWVTLKNVHLENIFVENEPGWAVLHMQIVRENYSNDVELTDPVEREDYRGHIDGVTVKNLVAENGTGIVIVGYDNKHLTENITLDGVKISGEPITSSTQVLTNDYVNDLTITAGEQSKTTDDFNNSFYEDRNWQIKRGNWSVLNGVLKQTSVGGAAMVLHKNVYENGCVTADLMLKSNGQTVGVVGRAQDDKNYYLARLNNKNNKLELYKVHNGLMTLLGSRDADVQINKVYNLFLNMNGGQLQCGIDGNVFITASDNTFSSGKTGLYGYTWYRNMLNTFEIDNYSVQ